MVLWSGKRGALEREVLSPPNVVFTPPRVWSWMSVVSASVVGREGCRKIRVFSELLSETWGNSGHSVDEKKKRDTRGGAELSFLDHKACGA